MTPEGGTWEQGMAALEELDQALPERAHPSCPNCGRRELRAQYIGVPTDRIGYAAIWCDHCHWGAYTGRAEIPAAADMLPFGVSQEVLNARIPDFREVTYSSNDEVIAQFEGGLDEAKDER